MKNIIRVNEEKLNELLLWGNKNNNLVAPTITNVFESGIIDIVGTGNTLHFKNNGSETEFIFKNNNKFVLSFIYERTFSGVGETKKLKYNLQLEGQKDYMENAKKELVCMYNYLNAYIQHNPKEIRQSKGKSEANSVAIEYKKKNINTERKNNVITINNVVYRNYNNDTDNTEKRNYTRHTESWTSRGHWRHYKSGKKVWIKQCIKGEKSMQVERVYSL